MALSGCWVLLAGCTGSLSRGPEITPPSWAPSESSPLARQASLELHGGSLARVLAVTPGEDGLAVQIERIGVSDPWAVQLSLGGLDFLQGHVYDFEFEIRADRPRTVYCTGGLARSPWTNLGSYHAIEVTGQWQTHRVRLPAVDTLAPGRLYFDLGQGSSGSIEWRLLRLAENGVRWKPPPHLEQGGDLPIAERPDLPAPPPNWTDAQPAAPGTWSLIGPGASQARLDVSGSPEDLRRSLIRVVGPPAGAGAAALAWGGLELDRDGPYTLRFLARAPAANVLRIETRSRDHAEGRGLDKTAAIGTAWEAFHVVFFPTELDAQAALVFQPGPGGDSFELNGLEVIPPSPPASTPPPAAPSSASPAGAFLPSGSPVSRASAAESESP